MRFAILLLAFLPLICCQVCDQTWAWVTLAICAAVVLYIVLSIVHELRALAAMGRHEAWPNQR